jgi:DNA-binding PadR family transcriptional regulator
LSNQYDLTNGGKRVVERRLLKELQRSIVKNFLDTVVMVKLKTSGSLSGYDIMEYVQQKYGVLISSGTVYSLLYSLERKGLLKGDYASGKRLYGLTDEGLKAIGNIMNSKEEIKTFIGTILED